MAYHHDRYSYPVNQQHMYYPPVEFPQYPPRGHLLEHFYSAYGPAEYPDFVTHCTMQDELEEGGEVSTRPRLTKEQVDVLEAEFQSHPKPNGIVKRELAIQTKLSLQRVAVCLIPSP